MHSTKGRRWLALAALVFLAPAIRAEMITPDSILRPPPAVGSANGTPVYANNLVTNQYMAVGLNFSNSSTAITRLNGMAVWAPVETGGSTGVGVPGGGASGSMISTPLMGVVNYYAPWFGASLESPFTRTPLTVTSLTIETVGNMNPLWLRVYGQNGQELNITPVIQTDGNVRNWEFTGAGITSFAVVPPPGLEVAQQLNANWGIAAVSFKPLLGQAPEPSSLVFAGLGVLGLAAHFGWQRTRRRKT